MAADQGAERVDQPGLTLERITARERVVRREEGTRKLRVADDGVTKMRLTCFAVGDQVRRRIHTAVGEAGGRRGPAGVGLAWLQYDHAPRPRIVQGAPVADALHSVDADAHGEFLVGVRRIVLTAEPGGEQVEIAPRTADTGPYRVIRDPASRAHRHDPPRAHCPAAVRPSAR